MKWILSIFLAVLAILGMAQQPPSRAQVSSLLPGVSTTGLLAQYTMQEGSGTTLIDHSGRGNNGTFGSGSNAPSWSGGGLFFSTATAAQWVSLPAALNGAVTIQIYATPQVVNFATGAINSGVYNSVLAPAAGGSPALIMSGYQTTNGQLIEPWLWNGAAGTQGWQTYSAPHLYTFIFGNGSTNDQLWVDGVQTNAFQFQVDSNVLSSGNWQLGGNGSGFAFNGTIYYALFYSAALTQAQIQQNASCVNQALLNRGVSTSPAGPILGTANIYEAVGDSITFGQGVTNSYATSAVLTGLNATTTINKRGVTGTGADYGNAFAESIYVSDLNQFGANTVSVFLGTNNINAGMSVALTHSYIQATCLRIRQRSIAFGLNTKIFVMTPVSRTGQDANNQALANLIRANFRQYADGLCDVASDPLLGATSAYSNGTYFQGDGTHPTQAGQNLIGTYVQTCINRLPYLATYTPTSTAATSYTMVDADVDLQLTGSSAQTITLPTALGFTNQYLIIHNSGSNSATINPKTSSGQTINGSSSYTLAAGSTVKLQSVLVSASAGGCNWITTQ